MSQQIAVQSPEKGVIEFIPFGAAESIKLSVSIVRDLIAVATRAGKLPEPKDCMKFMMLCRARHLNPFEGDAFLLGYDTQSGPQFSLITAHQVFLKRAEACDEFEGMESGVILMVNDEIIEREGDFTMKGETLLGGWAKVFRKDRTKVCYKRLKLETFSSGRSRWEKDAAGMIVKCAEADALRSSFPSHLGGLYSAEEGATRNIDVEVSAIPAGRIGRAREIKSISETAAEESEAGETPSEQAAAESAPKAPATAATAEEPASSAPSAASLRKSILAKCGEINAGKIALMKALVKIGIAKEGETLDSMDAKQMAEVIDAWSEVADKIVNPESEG